jgi:hypothetical protein|eukprot:5022577-Prymnesium_polylepis.1
MANMGTLLQLCFMFGPGVGAGLSQLDNRAPFWVGAFTSFFALTLAFLYVKPPEELFPNGVPPDPEDSKKTDAATPDGKGASAAPADPEETNWKFVFITALGALGSNTAMSVMMVCQALYLHDIFGWGALEFGFVSMGTASASLIVRHRS